MKLVLEKFLLFAFPLWFCRLLASVYLSMRFKISLSQYGEDLILKNYFDSIGLTHGRYLDVGAYHPIGISNTALLHSLGWDGTVVDIDEHKLRAFELFRRERCKGICAAVTAEDSGHNEEVMIYKFRRLWSELDTLSLSAAQSMSAQRGIDFSTQTVESISINKLLDQVGPLDFLNIDIEGLDEQLLSAIDFNKHSPKVIVFEDNNVFGGSLRVRKILDDAGYDPLFISGGSVGYFLKEVGHA